MQRIIAASRSATPANWAALVIAASCLLLTGLAACGMPGPPAPSDQEALLEDFRSLAYQTERPVLGHDGRPRPRGDHLAKWTLPIRAALVAGDRADPAAPLPMAFQAMTADHLSDVAGLTGLDITLTPIDPTSTNGANLLIFLADDPFAAARRHHRLFAHKIRDRPSYERLLARMEGSATCFGFLWGGWPSGRSIDFAVVFIRSGRGPRTVEGCLVQEVTQVLGLMNDLAPDADSVFSDSGRQITLTARDRTLLRLLYDPRLRPGMSWTEVQPLARAALRDLTRPQPSSEEVMRGD